jgi:hypothetical protein
MNLPTSVFHTQSGQNTWFWSGIWFGPRPPPSVSTFKTIGIGAPKGVSKLAVLPETRRTPGREVERKPPLRTACAFGPGFAPVPFFLDGSRPRSGLVGPVPWQLTMNVVSARTRTQMMDTGRRKTITPDGGGAFWNGKGSYAGTFMPVNPE